MTRGEIWWVDFGLPFGSEPGFHRPVVVIQADDFNKSKLNTIIVIPLTTNLFLADYPGNVLVEKHDSSLSKDSVAVVPQLVVIDKRRFIERVSKLSDGIMRKISSEIQFVLDL